MNYYVKCPNTEFFLVRIFLYSVRIQENKDQKKLRIWTLSCNERDSISMKYFNNSYVHISFLFSKISTEQRSVRSEEKRCQQSVVLVFPEF